MPPRPTTDADAGGIPEVELAREITGRVLAELTPPPSTSRRAKRSSSAPFGIRGSEVAKFLVSMSAAVAVAYFGMKAAIQANTAQIENTAHQLDDARDDIDDQSAKLKAHEVKAAEFDKEVEKRIGTVERTTDRIEVKQEQTLDVLREIKTDLRDTRRRRDRRNSD